MTRMIARALAPVEHLLDALIDPARRERAVAWLLLAYAAVWSLYGALAKGSQDLHFDMGEMVVWSRDAGIGTPKHPPLAAWLVRVWFSVFPLTDASYYAFAMVLATFALWVAWRVSEPYLDAEKRIVGLVLLTLVPFFNFHALKYNANTVLTPLWAVATWCFLRSFETRSALWAAFAGLAAAAAMLGKYWSIFLLAGLGIAALADPRRSAYFRSAAPYMTIAVGALALAPHVVWIVANDFAPFTYAVTAHPATQWSALKSGLGYLLGAAAYLAVPAALALAAARPGPPALADTVWPREPARRLVLIAFLGPIVLPAIVAAIAKVEIVPLWAIGTATLLPIVLLSSPRITVPRAAAVRLLALGLVFPVLMTLAAPVIAIVIHRQGLSNYSTHYRLLAAAVDRTWRQTTSQPMRFVGSYTNIVNGIVFYLRDRPSTLEINDPRVTPWADAASVARAGIALVCPEPETACMDSLNARGKGLPRHAVTLSRRHFGVGDAPVRYVIVIVPPS
jgi:4-amino-4-deoxy-L-arabinose transferase-like glycosyltransferase